jgi:hypothetical protein
MSTRHERRRTAFRIERRITRDLKIPLWEGSSMDDHGWRCIPMPPGDPLEGWEVFDNSHDYKTTWFRRCTDHVVTACLAGAGRTVVRGAR